MTHEETLPPAPAYLEQVYLIERDTGLLCRILGLYAARGIDVLHVDYAYAAQAVMSLGVRVAAAAQGPDPHALRVLVDKAATFAGVLAAAERPAALAPAPQAALHATRLRPARLAS